MQIMILYPTHSFGVFVWEVFSFAKTPYGATPMNELVRYLEDGNRLPQPEVRVNELEIELIA